MKRAIAALKVIWWTVYGLLGGEQAKRKAEARSRAIADQQGEQTR